MHQGGEAQCLRAGELVAQRLVQHAAQARGVGAEQLVQPILHADLLGQHLERVVVDVEVVVVALVHAVEGCQLGQDRLEHAQAVRQLHAGERTGRDHEPAQLGEHALSGGLGHPRGGRLREPLGLRVGSEAELGGEAGQAQGPQRIALVGLRAQHAQGGGLEVGAAAERVDRLAGRRLERREVHRARHRIDGEVALAQIGLDRVALERREVVHALIAAVDHPPGAERLRQPEHGPLELGREGARGPRGVAGHRHVDVAHRAAQQLVAHGAADDPGLAHGTCRRRTRGSSAQVTS